jgi:hypothetical protein
MTAVHAPKLLLAVYPSCRGFGFVFFESPDAPFDWGMREISGRKKNCRALEALKKLIDLHRPEVLVIEDTGEPGSRRSTRIRRLYRMFQHLATAEFVDVSRCTKAQVRTCFADVGASTKHEIAKAIAVRIPAFARRMPNLRLPWSSIDRRQALFDAAALGLAYFAYHEPSPYVDDVLT